MKHSIISIAAASAAFFSLFSCNKAELSLPGPGPVSEVPVSFCIVNSGLLTKLVTDAAENTLTRVQIAVYNPDSLLVASGYADARGTLTLSLPAGISGYKVCALANSSTDLSLIGRYEQVFTRSSTLRSSADGLEMFCTMDDVTFNPLTPVELELEHFAAKVQLLEISDNIAHNPSFTIDRIFLVNVNTACLYDYSTPSLNYAQLGSYKSAETGITPLTSDAVDVTLTKGQTHRTVYSFYCYPNPTVTETAQARFTRLVVQATYMGRSYYYPVNVAPEGGTIEHNALYRITNLTITGPGSTDPDSPLTKESISFEVDVLEWADGYDQAVTI